jgi:small subunit ribosomal protein S21
MLHGCQFDTYATQRALGGSAATTRRPASPHGPTGEFGLSEIIIHEDENFERALKRFKKKVEKAGILSDLRKHRHYEKPSERRKRKLNAAIRKNRRTRV